MEAEKKVEDIVYEDFGFPILLMNCPMTKKFGAWFLDINLEKLQRDLLDLLIRKPAPLTGDEIRFIRKYFELTTTDFGKLFYVTHAAVLKWEKGDTPPPTTDVCIRFFVLAKLHKKDSEFGKLYREVHLEDFLKKEASHEPLKIEASEYLATA
jgi:hypothetical protein